MQKGRLWAVAAVLAVVAAACGGGDAGETTTTSTTIDFATTIPSSTTSTSSTTTLATTTTERLVATATTFRVQQDLKALGYFDGVIDGVAGPETQAALEQFQTAQGIPADGEFGPQTDAAMVPELMADTAYVEDLQERLADIDLYSGPIDGDYGNGTRTAVEKLQASCELEETGEIDIDTRVCLDQK